MGRRRSIGVILCFERVIRGLNGLIVLELDGHGLHRGMDYIVIRKHMRQRRFITRIQHIPYIM